MSAPATPPSDVQYVHKHPEVIRFPLMEQPFIGFLLAFVAGLLNAWTLAHADTFATVQSGNVVSSGFYLVDGDWAKFTPAIVSVLCFGVGSALSGVLMTAFLRSGRSFTPGMLFALFALLVIGTLLAALTDMDPRYIAFGVSFVAGGLGNSFHKNHGMLYGAVAVTFVVQMAFNFLMQSAFSKKGVNGEPNIYWSGVFFLVLLGFAGGGAIGFLADTWFNGASIAFAALLCAILGIVSLRQPSDPDPTPGGRFV